MAGKLAARRFAQRGSLSITTKAYPAATVVWLVLMQALLAQTPAEIEKAAAKYVPGVTWQARSVISGNFTCRGRIEHAILGVSASNVVIAVFVEGIKARPKVLRYSAKNRETAKLATESLDYDPREDPGYGLPGFQSSKSCMGLNLSDDSTDSAHIYWNHEARRFDDWSR